MLSVFWVVVAVLVAGSLAAWITFTATRLDRLHARVDAAQAALDAQLVRRAAAVQHAARAAGPQLDPALAADLDETARVALSAHPAEREPAENALGRAANQLADASPPLWAEHVADLSEVAESAVRVVIARRFYNDAVRDTRALRGRRMPRLLRLAGHRDNPQFFDIDDTTRWSLPATPSGGSQ